MNRIQEFINKYYKWIIIVLCILLGLKSCNSCSTKRQYEYQINKYDIKIDSLNNDIQQYKHYCDSLNTELFILKSENEILNLTVESTRKDVDYYRDANNSLINTNTNLVNVTESLSQKSENN